MKRITLLLFLTAQLAGCLKTKADLRNEGSDNTEQRQVVATQQAQAKPKTAAALKFDEYDDQMRAMNGRIDSVENYISQQNAAKKGEQDTFSKDRAVTDQRFVAYEEALKKLEAEVQTLNEEMARLKAPPAAAPAAPVSKKDSKTLFEDGQSQFSAKKWKDAILSYQKYRDANPKGKYYAEATYKMGVSFQELGLKDDAKPFLEEVVSKFPGSKEAKKATFRLKNSK